jgi:predicted RNase H-like nuclease
MVGVDGCRDGWLAVKLRGTEWWAEVFPTFTELVETHQLAKSIGVDIPIGLLHGGVRACDSAARKLLGRRHVCVFNPPDPRVLGFANRAEASDFLQGLGKNRITVQTWMIVPKIAEVDAFMTPIHQQRIVEVHPEVSFCALNGGNPVQSKKSRMAGFEERSALLRAKLGIESGTRRDLAKAIPRAEPDDVLDAIAAAWSARRYATDQASRLPDSEIKNDRGLRMKIIY